MINAWIILIWNVKISLISVYLCKLIQEVMTEALWADKPFGMNWSNWKESKLRVFFLYLGQKIQIDIKKKEQYRLVSPLPFPPVKSFMGVMLGKHSIDEVITFSTVSNPI